MKKITTIIFISIVFFLEKSSAQFTSNWENRYNHTVTTGFSNEGRKVAVDAIGNVFELCDVTSDKDTAGHPVTTTQYYVVLRKLNASSGSVIATTEISV